MATIQRSLPFVLAAIAASPALAQTVVVSLPVDFDRWNYPFGDADGQRTTIPTYTTLGSGAAGFDDRDAECLLSFATSPSIPVAPVGTYTIQSAVVTMYISMADTAPSFAFDPTYDAAASYVPGGAVADTDPGRPIEMFGAGYRAGWTSLTFVENSPFSSGPPSPPPARGNRNVIPIDFGGAGGVARDVSNNITNADMTPNPFEVYPIAIGQATGIADPTFTSFAPPPAVGATVPNRTRFEFAIDVSNPSVQNYLREGLAVGRLNLVVTCIAPSSSFGSGPVTYPIFFSQENILGRGASIALSVASGAAGCNIADVTNVGGTVENPGSPDNQLTVDDIILFVNAFSDGSGCPGVAPCNKADVTGIGGPPSTADGQLTVDDIIAFVNAFSEGCV